MTQRAGFRFFRLAMPVLLVLGCSSGPDSGIVGPDPNVETVTIGSGGGRIESPPVDGFASQVDFPSGALPDGTQVQLRYGVFGGGDAHTPAWELHIGPNALCRPVRIAVSGFDAITDPVFFMVADTLAREVGSSTMLPQSVQATVDGAQAVFVLPAHEDCPLAPFESRSSGGQTASGGVDARRYLTFWGVLGYAAHQTERFRVVYPVSMYDRSVDMPRELLAYAEEAYRKLESMNYRFRDALNWPVTIDVKFGMQADGDVSIPLSGKANQSININAALCKPETLTELRATMGHEFFHVVQKVYDPRSGIRIRNPLTTPYFYWLAEASSIWFESIMLDDPDHVAGPFVEQIPVYYHQGLETFGNHQQAMERGYAASGFLGYLVDDKGPDLVRRAWEAVRAQGSDPRSYSDLRALMDAVGSGVETGWLFEEYMSKLLTNLMGNPDYNPRWPVFSLSPNDASVDVTADTREKEIRASIEPFAAQRWRISFKTAGSGTGNDALEAVEVDPGFSYHVFQYDTSRRRFVHVASPTEDTPWEFTAKEGDEFIVIAVNTSGWPDYRQPRELAVRLLRETAYEVSVSAAPPAGGTVSGGGTFQEGTTVTVRASANAGYTFTQWTEEGSLRSRDPSYTFEVTSDRNLVAHFDAEDACDRALIWGRYQPTGDSCEQILDTVTGLEWQRCSVGQSWTGSTCIGEATKHNWAAGRALTAPGGFRFPHVDELRSLVFCSSGDPSEIGMPMWTSCKGEFTRPTIVADAFPGTPEDYYWSSGPCDEGECAYFVHFYYGSVGSYFPSSFYHVRLVRAAE